MNKLSSIVKKRPKSVLMAAALVGALVLVAVLAPLATDASSTGYVLMRKTPVVTLTAGSTEVKVGEKVHLSGQLSGVINKAYAKISLAVTLPDGTITYPAQGSSTYTSRTGTFSVDIVPKVSGKHIVTATYSSGRVNTVATKEISAISISTGSQTPSKVATSMALTLESPSIVLGGTMTAAGTLSAGAGVVGAPVSVTVVLPDGTSVNMGRSQITTGAEGAFSVEYTPTVIGSYKLTATYAGSGTLNPSTTSVSFAVTSPAPQPLTKTSLSLTPASTSVETGRSMYATGVLTASAPVSGASVAVKVVLPDGTTVNPSQGSSVITGSDGAFSMDYTPATAGSYKLTATFAGNGQYDASTVTVSFTVTTPSTPVTPGTGGSSVSYNYIVTSSGSNYVTKDASGTTVYSGTNAATAIQTALNSLSSGRTVKQTVLLQGTFVITKAISIPSYTILELDGKVTWGSSAVGYMLTASSKSNFEVRGGEWDGNKGIRSTTSSSNPMNFERCQDVVISNLKVHDGPYDNIEFLYGERITISGVESYRSNWDSFMMAFCNNCVVENCHIYDIKQGGCYFYCEDDGIAQTINNNIMRNNLVERTLTSGLSLSPRGAEDKVIGGLIEGNTLVDCGTDGDHPAINTGFAVHGQGTIIRNNVISCPAGLSGAGIEFGVDNGQCTGNTVSGTGESGISCTGSGNIISGNVMRSCGSQGYSAFYNGGSNNVVTGNTIS
jgi:hypothetical protein